MYSYFDSFGVKFRRNSAGGDDSDPQQKKPQSWCHAANLSDSIVFSAGNYSHIQRYNDVRWLEISGIAGVSQDNTAASDQTQDR